MVAMYSYYVKKIVASALKKGEQKDCTHVDEADLPHQPARNAFGILWAGRTCIACTSWKCLHIILLKSQKIETQKFHA